MGGFLFGTSVYIHVSVVCTCAWTHTPAQPGAGAAGPKSPLRPAPGRMAWKDAAHGRTALEANSLRKHLFSGFGERDELSLRREARPQGDVIAHTAQGKMGREASE